MILKYVPKRVRTAQIIMPKKPGKPDEEVASYIPILFVANIFKMFEKLLLKCPVITELEHSTQA